MQINNQTFITEIRFIYYKIIIKKIGSNTKYVTKSIFNDFLMI